MHVDQINHRVRCFLSACVPAWGPSFVFSRRLFSLDIGCLDWRHVNVPRSSPDLVLVCASGPQRGCEASRPTISGFRLTGGFYWVLSVYHFYLPSSLILCLFAIFRDGSDTTQSTEKSQWQGRGGRQPGHEQGHESSAECYRWQRVAAKDYCSEGESMWLVSALADVETSRPGIWQQQTRAEQVTRYTSPGRCSILLDIDHDPSSWLLHWATQKSRPPLSARTSIQNGTSRSTSLSLVFKVCSLKLYAGTRTVWARTTSESLTSLSKIYSTMVRFRKRYLCASSWQHRRRTDRL